ncbi:MAG: protein archease [Desulfuromonas sp.]|uniref:archease n=1 Tax=Desulfuromonas sp. TaxID=892 RepID=UPI000CA87F93|nr:archease [Desulfuromonas sp.]PLX83506.1 MAG: protein archease [Desulfuromonas sp.]
MASYRLLEHTADMGIEASAATLEELFVEAARGLTEILFGVIEASPFVEETVTIGGADREELLVNWLNEILFLFEIRSLVPLDFQVSEVGKDFLKGVVRGTPFDPKEHLVQREVKAATYHQVKVEKRDDLWRARVYLDL